jgi:arginase
LFPLANFPHFNGLSLEEAGACLELFLAEPQCAGLVVTEVNPHHDPDGTLLAVLRDTVVRAATGLVDEARLG